MAKKKKATAKAKEASTPVAARDNIPISGHPRIVDIQIPQNKNAAKRDEISRLSAAEVIRPRVEMTAAQIRDAADVQRPRDRAMIAKTGAAILQSRIRAAQIIEHRGNIGIISVYVAEIGRSIVFDLKSFEEAYKNRIIRGA